ncbi:MAG TPA: hypothetical protein VHG08_23405 [Longimicrobium sp.]|nr:hypothetical protein [Longimicrobium sp.]
MTNPPSLTCYLNQPGSTAYLVVGTDLQGPACGLVQQGATLFAVLIQAPVGWNARFVAVY